MKVKYNNSDILYNISDYEVINFERTRLIGAEAQDNASGFNIYDDNGSLLQSCQEHKVVYEVGDGFVEYTNDTYVYYIYYTFNEEGYITDSLSSWQYPVDNGIFIDKGQGKKYMEPPQLDYMDEDGLYNYKAVDGKMVKISDEEKAATKEANMSAEYKQTKSFKLNELSETCAANITNGVDYEGKHYSYTLEDQNNIKSAVSLATETGLDVPYHANGEACCLYTPEAITAIYVINETNLTHHTTYHNQLKLYVETLKTAEEIAAVEYGQPLTGDYLVTYVTIMEQSKKIIAAFLGVNEETVEGILGKSATMSAAL